MMQMHMLWMTSEFHLYCNHHEQVIMKTIKKIIPSLIILMVVVSCIDENAQVTPLSSDTIVSIPSASNNATVLESSTDGLLVPIVLGQEVVIATSVQVRFTSTDGTTYNTDYTTTPAADGEGVVTISLNPGDTEALLTINPILEEGFNENKTIDLAIEEVGDGLILSDFSSFAVTIVNKPIIEVSSSTIDFGTIDSGDRTDAVFTLTGLGLLGDIDITSSSSDFLVFDESTSSFGESTTVASANAEQEELSIALRFDAFSGTLGSKSGTITLSSESADDVTISLTGEEASFVDFVSSGFEDVDLTGLGLSYTKSGLAELNNNPGEAPVDFIATGSELGFDSSFDPNDIGDDGGERIGVGGVTNLFDINDDLDSVAFAYNGGSQGYHTSDLDGTLEIVFDEVTIPASAQHLEFSMAVYLTSFEGNYDAGEGVELVWRTSEGDTPLIDIEDLLGTGDFTINGNFSFAMDEWGTVKAPLDVSVSGSTGRVVIRVFNDNNDDVYLVDDVSIRTAE